MERSRRERQRDQEWSKEPLKCGGGLRGGKRGEGENRSLGKKAKNKEREKSQGGKRGGVFGIRKEGEGKKRSRKGERGTSIV